MDVDLDAATATICRQLDDRGRESDTKADASDPTIALDSATAAALRRQQDHARHIWGQEWKGGRYVFTREDGSPLQPSTLNATFQRIAHAAGLPPIRPHDLRHGAATLMLAGGAEMKTVQQALRHSSYTITADTYTNVLHQVAHDAAEAAAALIPRATEPAPGTALRAAAPPGPGGPGPRGSPTAP